MAEFTLPERRAIKKIALGRPTDYGEPFATWSLTKLADHLVRKGVVDDISHEGLRALLREFLAFCRYIRTLHPPMVRTAIVLDNLSPHLSTKLDTRVGDWAETNNVEVAYTPHYASWLKPDRSPVHRLALLLSRRDRP